jgi:hypothetical protein
MMMIMAASLQLTRIGVGCCRLKTFEKLLNLIMHAAGCIIVQALTGCKLLKLCNCRV